MVDDAHSVKHVMVPESVLPKKARVFLCITCNSALEQLAGQALLSEAAR
jgi:hypothetical protein